MATERIVTIPSGVTIEVAGSTVRVSGPKGQLERSFRFPQITLAIRETGWSSPRQLTGKES